jgi:hypothetical protein
MTPHQGLLPEKSGEGARFLRRKRTHARESDIQYSFSAFSASLDFDCLFPFVITTT